MMDLLLYSNRPESPSWQFYSSLFAGMNCCPGLRVRYVVGGDRAPDLGDADVALLFGANFDVPALRTRYPKARLGHLEPRAAQCNSTEHYDFVVVNSIEAADYFTTPGQSVFIFPTFPIMQPPLVVATADLAGRPLRIGYHGNRIHLESMYPRITEALIRLGALMDVEFWAMYNMRDLGRWSTKGLKGVKVNHIQYDLDNYSRYIAQVDIGVVPQLIPVRSSRLVKWLMGSPFSRFNERHDNFVLRFKETTNNGRAFVFAQYEIPVVADMVPSSCALLGENEFGFLAHSSNQWFNALAALAQDVNLRRKMGAALKDRYESLAKPEDVNRRFAQFLSSFSEIRSTTTRPAQ